MTSAVEFRVEADADVAPHVHARGVQLLEAEPSLEGEQLREALLRVLRQLLSVLCHNQARAARPHLPARPPAAARGACTCGCLPPGKRGSRPTVPRCAPLCAPQAFHGNADAASVTRFSLLTASQEYSRKPMPIRNVQATFKQASPIGLGGSQDRAAHAIRSWALPPQRGHRHAACMLTDW
jgi:hypothetical protein